MKFKNYFIPKKLKETLKETNEKVSYVVSKKEEVWLYWVFIYALIYWCWVSFHTTIPLDIQILIHKYNYYPNIFSLIYENIIAFIPIILLLKHIEYLFFTTIVITNNKIIIQRFYKIITIYKTNFHYSYPPIFPLYSVLKTFDGKNYFFASSLFMYFDGKVFKTLEERDKFQKQGREKLKQKYIAQKNQLFGWNGILARKLHLAQIIIAILFFCPVIGFLYFSSLNEYEFFDFSIPFKNFKYFILSESTQLLDKMQFQDSKITQYLRNESFKQYYVIYNSFYDNLYNAIAPFYWIAKEHSIYKSSPTKNDALFQKQNEKVLKEIDKIFEEYEQRNLYYYADVLVRGHYWVPEYYILDRLGFYLTIAVQCLEFENDEQTENYLVKLHYRLKQFDSVFEQEQSTDSPMYRYILNSSNNDIFKHQVLNFYYVYSTKIIDLENKLHPETFCENTYIFDKYNEAKEFFSDNSSYYDNLLKTKCNYK